MKIMTRRPGIVAAILLLACALAHGPATFAQSACGPMDVTFVIDNTGSMALVNAEIQAQVAKIADAVVVASGNNYQFGLIALPRNDVEVLLDMSLSNRTALATATADLVNEGSCGLAASWDEGMNTAINGLGPRTGTNGQQIGTFSATWRPDAAKIIIVISDTDPSGFDCELITGIHDVRSLDLADSALAADIAITTIYVPTGGGSVPEDDVKALMQAVSDTSGGLFRISAADASNLSDVIVEVIDACGGQTGGGVTRSLQVTPGEVAVATGEGFDATTVNYAPGDLTTLFYDALGVPPGATVTFSRENPALVEGTDQQRMHIQIGPDTPPGTYFVYAQAHHTDSESVLSDYVLVVVDCKPPGIFGTAQPQTQLVHAGAAATFNVSAFGSGRFTYQWYQGFTGMTRVPVNGATGTSFHAPAVQEMTPYWVRVTNVCGTYDSLTAYSIPQ
ncbi:MAG: hypothetical protein ABI779_15115 [Acidobacteriota bacterium]